MLGFEDVVDQKNKVNFHRLLHRICDRWWNDVDIVTRRLQVYAVVFKQINK